MCYRAWAIWALVVNLVIMVVEPMSSDAFATFELMVEVKRWPQQCANYPADSKQGWASPQNAVGDTALYASVNNKKNPAMIYCYNYKFSDLSGTLEGVKAKIEYSSVYNARVEQIQFWFKSSLHYQKNAISNQNGYWTQSGQWQTLVFGSETNNLNLDSISYSA